MNADASSRPRSDNAASWRAATQPSVRCSSAATSSADSCRPADVVEVGGRLVPGEAQVGGAELGELAAGSQTSQRQGRVGAGADDQAHLRRQVVDQERHPGPDRWAVDEVVVVEDQRHLVGQHAELVEELRQHLLGGLATRLEQGEDSGADAGHDAVQRGDDVRPERGCGTRRLSRGTPTPRARRHAWCRQPGAEERGLAEACRRRDQDQAPAALTEATGEVLAQPWPCHQVRAPSGRNSLVSTTRVLTAATVCWTRCATDYSRGRRPHGACIRSRRACAPACVRPSRST